MEPDISIGEQISRRQDDATNEPPTTHLGVLRIQEAKGVSDMPVVAGDWYGVSQPNMRVYGMVVAWVVHVDSKPNQSAISFMIGFARTQRTATPDHTAANASHSESGLQILINSQLCLTVRSLGLRWKVRC
jgi:hypothetical protein